MKTYKIKEFRKHPNYVDTYQVKINNKWLDLCVCVNCKKVHAVHTEMSLINVDIKFKCCAKPNNWTCSYGAKELIEEFIEDNGGLTE